MALKEAIALGYRMSWKTRYCFLGCYPPGLKVLRGMKGAAAAPLAVVSWCAASVSCSVGAASSWPWASLGSKLSLNLCFSLTLIKCKSIGKFNRFLSPTILFFHVVFGHEHWKHCDFMISLFFFNYFFTEQVGCQPKHITVLWSLPIDFTSSWISLGFTLSSNQHKRWSLISFVPAGYRHPCYLTC